MTYCGSVGCDRPKKQREEKEKRSGSKETTAGTS